MLLSGQPQWLSVVFNDPTDFRGSESVDDSGRLVMEVLSFVVCRVEVRWLLFEPVEPQNVIAAVTVFPKQEDS